MTNLTIREKSELVEVYSVLENRDFISVLNRVFSIKKSCFSRVIKIFKGV